MLSKKVVVGIVSSLSVVFGLAILASKYIDKKEEKQNDVYDYDPEFDNQVDEYGSEPVFSCLD